MDPKTFSYGETISYLKLNGSFDDEVEVNSVVASESGYSFVPEDLGKDNSAALQLRSNKNIIIKDVLNAGTPVHLSVPDPYTLLACTTSFWVKQYSTSETIDGFHPIQVIAHAQNENNEDIYFTYTNKTQTTFDIEIRDGSNNILAQQSITRSEYTIPDNWLHVSFIIYKGMLSTDDGAMYDGYIMDLFVDGEHLGFAISEGSNLPVIDKLVSVSIAPYDTTTYLTNASIGDLKVVNKLEYYPSDKSKFVPEEVENGVPEFIYKGEIIIDGLERRVSCTLYHSDLPHIISKVMGGEDSVIDCVAANKWTNNGDYIQTSTDTGKVYNNSVLFPGNNLQSYVLDRNILYGLDEFTIAAWVKTIDNTIPNTLLEIVPRLLLDLTEDDLKYIPQKDIDAIENYKAKFRVAVNSVNVNIYDDESTPHGVGIDISELSDYNVGDWNYIATTFKNNVIRLFVNGKLIQEKEADLELNLYSKLSADMYSVIGASFIDDLPISQNKSTNMYMDDFIIYDKAIFTSDFPVPTEPMVPYYMQKGSLYDSSREIIQPASQGFDTERYIRYIADIYSDSRRIVLNPTKYVVFRFSI